MVPVLTIGSGEPLLLLHGGGLAAAMWKPLMVRLRETHSSVAPELPPDDPALTDLHLQVIEAALGLAASPAHLVGHSYGGGLALRAALAHPERLATLVLIEPTLPAVLRSAGEGAAADELVRWRRELNRAEPMAAAERFMEVWGGADFWRWLPPSSRERVAAWVVDCDGDAWNHFYESETLDMRALAALPVPTLLLSGETSPLSAKRTCEVLARTIPGASHRILSGVGHMSPITHPQLVIPEVAAHLRAHPIGVAART
jgi:pimeloyl-ACP methyl ester carboxylesterase